MANEKCVWAWFDNGARYETECGHGADHYSECEYFKYCPYCGREIEVKDGE
jgi:hypothetical protein